MSLKKIKKRATVPTLAGLGDLLRRLILPLKE
jgi:hypothetical protein